MNGTRRRQPARGEMKQRSGARSQVDVAYILPIDAEQRARVVAATQEWIERAGKLFQRKFPELPVLFDLRGRMAGMYRVAGERRVIRYNPWLFAKYLDDGMGVTVPHEVAHYITDLVYGFARIRPHGSEWQALMHSFGIDPRAAVRHRLDLSGIPMRTQRRHLYRCDCREHQLSGVRHARVQREAARYVCRKCGAELVQMV
ncbi:MAG: SprT-like domain-containing protein [Chromatiales bacterium]|nr:SprT-like domain-containing protein [Chromatiales bacterium]